MHPKFNARHQEYASEQNRCVSWPHRAHSMIERIYGEAIIIKYDESHDLGSIRF